jgi:riboflavin synthase
VTADAAPGDSIAVSGVCLTVVDVHEGVFTADVMKETFDHTALGTHFFEVSLIPTTLALTTLGHKQVGDLVNLEVDVIAKYVERLLLSTPVAAPMTVSS